MTIRGGGEPDIWNGFKAEEENGPAARSLADDANDCIMVWIPSDSPNTSLRRDAPESGLPSDWQLYTDCLEHAAVLGAIKAAAFGWPPRRPTLTGPARGSVTMSPVEARKRFCGRTKKLYLDIERPIQARSRRSIARSQACRSRRGAPRP
jgi:hypothetical protein